MSPRTGALRRSPGAKPARPPASAEPARLRMLDVSPGHARVRIRPARSGDVEGMLALMAPQIAAGNLLPRTSDDILARLGEFLVLEGRSGVEWRPEGDRPPVLLGVAALHHYSADDGARLAEVRSLTIAAGHEGRGFGRRLLDALIARAQEERIARLIALTRSPGFFERSGFEHTTLEALPEKIARDCRFCPKRDSCDEVAMVREI